VRRRDRLKSRDIYTKFYKDWFSHSKVDRWDSQTQRQPSDFIRLFALEDGQTEKPVSIIGMSAEVRTVRFPKVSSEPCCLSNLAL
jgi:hypothetical protein